MAEDQEKEEGAPRAGSSRVTLLACALLIVVAAVVTIVIFSTQPVAQRTTETRKSAMLVEVITVRRDSYRPEIMAMGVVEPSREIVLSPRVRGQITERAPAFSPGGFLEEGQLILRIDPSDYANLLAQRESELQQATADLNIEMGRQKVAELDLELLEESMAVANKDLALRQPQLNAARSRIASAQAAVDQAQLDLERCEIVAPFDVQVIERNVDVGSQVAPGDELGRLVGLDTYWVVTTVPLSSLPWIALPDGNGGGAGSKVQVRNRSAWPEGTTREGTVERLIGALDEETRLARLLVTIDDPLARRSDSAGVPSLIIGSVLETFIEGREIPGVVRLERNYLRENDTVWIMEEDKLRILPVKVVFRDARFAYLEGDLESGDKVVTTSLRTVADGAPLRLAGEDMP